MIKKKGFTLLEVTIVLGIGTLIAFMKFQDMRNDQDKELVMGILLSVSDLNDIEKITYIKAGRKFLAQMDGRQK